VTCGWVNFIRDRELYYVGPLSSNCIHRDGMDGMVGVEVFSTGYSLRLGEFVYIWGMEGRKDAWISLSLVLLGIIVVIIVT
jgi:hypothetical protein